jgi:uncharacterized membrane protein (DUF373 family)
VAETTVDDARVTAPPPSDEGQFDLADPMVRTLTRIIRIAVRALAVLMTGVIVFGVADVVYVLYQRIIDEPFGLLEISDILATFGAFMAVLIAIEIFINITSYLRDDVIHVRIVLATALMAIARKVIVLDFEATEPLYVFATATVLVAAAIAYYLVRDSTRRSTGSEA